MYRIQKKTGRITDEALRVDLCGVAFDLRGRGGFPDDTARRYRGFHASGPAGVRLDLEWDDPMELSLFRDPAVDVEGRRWRIHRNDFDGAYDPAARRGNVRLVSRPTTLDSFLRVLLSALLLDSGGMLVHAASLRIGDGGLLFPGPSGRGKSTLASKAGRSRILSDEISCVTGAGPGARLRGTPFWGNFREGRLNVDLPLRGIFFLDRELPPGVHPIRRADAFRRLLECVLFFTADLGMNRRLLASAAALLDGVPTALLSYPIGMPWGEVCRMIRSVKNVRGSKQIA